jgi:hypothetical protein
MTESQRNLLFEALMEGTPSQEKIGLDVRREMEGIVTDDIDRIEPLIDEMILAGFEAGKAFANRKTESDIVKGRTHVLSL